MARNILKLIRNVGNKKRVFDIYSGSIYIWDLKRRGKFSMHLKRKITLHVADLQDCQVYACLFDNYYFYNNTQQPLFVHLIKLYNKPGKSNG